MCEEIDQFDLGEILLEIVEWEYERPNFAPELFVYEPYDIHCPLAGAYGSTALNFWSSSCKMKQKNPDIPSCYGGCKGEIYAKRYAK